TAAQSPSASFCWRFRPARGSSGADACWRATISDLNHRRPRSFTAQRWFRFREARVGKTRCVAYRSRPKTDPGGWDRVAPRAILVASAFLVAGVVTIVLLLTVLETGGGPAGG